MNKRFSEERKDDSTTVAEENFLDLILKMNNYEAVNYKNAV